MNPAQQNVVAPVTKSGVALPEGSIDPRNYVGNPNLGSFIDWDQQFMEKGMPPPAEANEFGTPSEWLGQVTGFGRAAGMSKAAPPGDPTGRLIPTGTGTPYEPGVQGDDPYVGSAAGEVSEYHPQNVAQPAPAGVPPAAKMSGANPMPFAMQLAPMMGHMGSKQVPGLPDASGEPVEEADDDHAKMSRLLGMMSQLSSTQLNALVGMMRGKKHGKMNEGFGPSSARMAGGESASEGRGTGLAPYDASTEKSLDAALEDLRSIMEEPLRKAQSKAEYFESIGKWRQSINGKFRRQEKKDMRGKIAIPALAKMSGKHKGEGSRGGKIIGHTKSGKPIYGSTKALAKKVEQADSSDRAAGGKGHPDVHHSMQAHKEHFKATSQGFTSQDHKDAASAIDDHKYKKNLQGSSRWSHNLLANEHRNEADKKSEKELADSHKQHDDAFHQHSRDAHGPSIMDRYPKVKNAIANMPKGAKKSMSAMQKAEREGIPQEYLYDYLCGCIEQAYERESRETEHQNVSAKDQLTAMASAVMHSLVRDMRYNGDVRRACTAYKVTRDVVAAILISKGIYKPKADSDWASDLDSNAAMGMPMNEGIAGSVFAFSNPPTPFIGQQETPPRTHTLVDRTIDVSHLVKSDDRDPHVPLRAAELARMRALYGTGLEVAQPNVAADCPVHNGKDISKAQNLHNPMQPCTCGATANPWG
jgi:hypothetical protein